MKSGVIKCRNLKISLRLAQDFDLERVHQHENFHETNCSYLVFNNCNKCVITVYKHTLTQLHVTGICSKADLHYIFSFVCTVLKNLILTGSIQNSLFSFKNDANVANSNFNFKNVVKTFVNNIYSIKFNTEVFPAMFLKENKEF